MHITDHVVAPKCDKITIDNLTSRAVINGKVTFIYSYLFQ